MIGIRKKLEDTIITGEIVESVEKTYGTSTLYIDSEELPLVIYFIPNRRQTVLFSVGISFLENALHDPHASKKEIIAFVPAGIQGEDFLENEIYAPLLDAIENAYHYVERGSILTEGNLLINEAESAFSPLKTFVLMEAPAELVPCTTKKGNVEFLVLVALSPTEVDYYEREGFKAFKEKLSPQLSDPVIDVTKTKLDLAPL